MQLVIGFSTPKSNLSLSRLISWYMKVPYSHTYIRFHSDKFDRELLYEASHGSCHFIEYGNFKDKNIICDEFKCSITEEKKVEIIKFCIDNAQKPYGFWTLVGIFFNLNIGKDGNKSFICSELVGKIIGASSSDFYTPKQMYDYCQSTMDKQ